MGTEKMDSQRRELDGTHNNRLEVSNVILEDGVTGKDIGHLAVRPGSALERAFDEHSAMTLEGGALEGTNAVTKLDACT